VRDAAKPDEAEARQRSAHTNRDLSTWVDREGAGRLAWRGTTVALAGLRAALDPFVKEQLTRARREQRDASYGACAADALCALADAASGNANDTGSSSESRRRRARPVMRVRLDYEPLLRGRTEPGEVCEIEGVGSVPVSAIDTLAGLHPIVDLVLTRGREVTHVAHLGRSGDTFLKSAIEWRDPHCRVHGCTSATGLEVHHLDPVGDGGSTSLERQVRVCGHHHDRITHHGHQLIGSHQTGWSLRAPPPPDTG
jgi:hypothetical protein